MLSADRIEKRFTTRSGELTVLREVTLTVEPGESVVVMGPSGSGKSTLLNVLGTLEPPSGGQVRIDGCDPFSLSEPELARFRNRRIGFVFQEHHLLPQCSVLENVLMPTLVGDSGKSALGRAESLLERVGLADRLDHRPAELSGGERQRTALARALINRPAVVLADEPTGNLDRAASENVADLLAGLQKEEGVILVVATHSEKLAARFGRCHDLVDGRLVPR